MAGREGNRGAALVTGAGQRIGRAIARALADSGYAVAIHYHRSQGEARTLAAEIAADGGRSAVFVADLTDPAALARLVEESAAALGPLTLLVNNAAIFELDKIGSLERELWDRQFSINLAAPVFLTEAFAAQAPAGRSAIVNLLDPRVLKPTPHFLSYTLAKAALATATYTLAQALAPRIRVNAVAPGPTLPSPRQRAADFARQTAALPLGRGPTPEEVAAAVVFLATAASVTGAVLPVDGGQHLAWATPEAGVHE
ncbi:MAG: SDR family oxidoreductase [Xanthobacteraceae bacterium]|nr:SDR family oxidoreductase [Xanthobacteraceae bacterium]